MIFSQALIGFAGMLFLPSAMMAGLMSALAKGPQYILSFVIVFISTQSLGGVLGSGLFTTFTTHRQAVHLQDLAVQMTPTDPATVQALAGRMAALAATSPDAVARRAQAAAQLVAQANLTAWTEAYADAYALTGWAALLAASALVLHLWRDRMAAKLTDKPT